jgi:hypothetical protein
MTSFCPRLRFALLVILVTLGAADSQAARQSDTGANASVICSLIPSAGYESGWIAGYPLARELSKAHLKGEGLARAMYR